MALDWRGGQTSSSIDGVDYTGIGENISEAASSLGKGLGTAFSKVGSSAYGAGAQGEGFTDEERLSGLDAGQFQDRMKMNEKVGGTKGLLQRVMPWGQTGYKNKYDAQQITDMDTIFQGDSTDLERQDLMKTNEAGDQRISADMLKDMRNRNAISEEQHSKYNAQMNNVGHNEQIRKNNGIVNNGSTAGLMGQEEAADPWGPNFVYNWWNKK